MSPKRKGSESESEDYETVSKPLPSARARFASVCRNR
jgi:hypothetical protein